MRLNVIDLDPKSRPTIVDANSSAPIIDRDAGISPELMEPLHQGLLKQYNEQALSELSEVLNSLAVGATLEGRAIASMRLAALLVAIDRDLDFIDHATRGTANVDYYGERLSQHHAFFWTALSGAMPAKDADR